MKIRKKVLKRIIVSWSALLLLISVACVLIFVRARSLVFVYARSQAETIMLSSANKAVIRVLNRENITYDGISRISRDDNNNITGIEIDIKQLNSFKSEISNEIMQLIEEKSRYTISIPIGSFISSEYTVGLGPNIDFKMQMTETATVDFDNEFTDAGLNQVMHRIIVKIDISANILMLGKADGFSVSTTAVAAQTVIVGKVPESFTNVEEHPDDDIADTIFNYADLE